MRAENDHNNALKSFQRAIDFNSKNSDIYKEIGKTLYVVNGNALPQFNIGNSFIVLMIRDFFLFY